MKYYHRESLSLLRVFALLSIPLRQLRMHEYTLCVCEDLYRVLKETCEEKRAPGWRDVKCLVCQCEDLSLEHQVHVTKAD